MRVLCQIVDSQLLAQIERYLKQAVVDKSPVVAASVLSSALHLMHHVSGGCVGGGAMGYVMLLHFIWGCGGVVGRQQGKTGQGMVGWGVRLGYGVVDYCRAQGRVASCSEAAGPSMKVPCMDSMECS